MKSKKFWKSFFALGEVERYFFRKREPARKPGFSLKMMRGVNKFSAIVFLLAVLYLILKRLLA